MHGFYQGSRSGLVTWDYKNTLTQWCVFSTYFRLEDALVGEESSDLYKLLAVGFSFVNV